MKSGPWSRIVLLSSGILAVVPVKCNSIFAKSSPEADDGYEYVTSSESRIPKRVPKGTKSGTDTNLGVVSGEALQQIGRKLGPIKAPAGQ